MCGIAGVYDPGRPAADVGRVVSRMSASLVHRGPDEVGSLSVDGLGLGIRRLSIIDVAGGHQPIANEDESVYVVCNGEIYNHDALRSELVARGHRFRTRSDAEVIVHLYEEEGPGFVSRLRGMFGVAVWDQRSRRLVLARDRLGQKPLFYAHRGDRLLFGSEIKALLAADPSLAESDPEALVPYLRFGYVPQPRTMFRHVRKLPAGHYMVHGGEGTTVRPYWSLEFPDVAEPGSPRRWAEELDALLEESVRLRLMSEVPLGIFLSGGLDSSAMVAYAHRAGLSPIKTFTIGFDRAEWDESADAALVAGHFGTDHHELTLGEEDMKRALPDALRTIVRQVDEPFGDQAALPTYFVSKLAREHVTVILSGDGSDELFAGYSTYHGVKIAEMYRRLPRWLGTGLFPTVPGAVAPWLPSRAKYAANRATKVLRDSSLPFAECYFSKVHMFEDRLLRELLNDDLHPLIDSASADLAAQVEPVLRGSWPDQSKQSYLDLRLGLLDGMLVKVDRMSMAHSLEVRSPFLDHRLVELATRIPPSLKLRGWERKAILRDVMRPQLPLATLRKRKQGFRVPLREWLRDSFEDMGGDYLSEGSGTLPKELFDLTKVGHLVRQHRQGQMDHGRRLWSLLNYAAWQDLYLNAYAGQPR